ncbi:50S ribosomal protein L4 [Saccharolobus islandicus]|jgi:large subunit ribosomal protein L4e|uniref:Large ribosomal subunit protein uL4 n=5 Tax=Saccharolobus islandicus TaxID=43080 RepID=RL4_SACI3|nr:50S ribosomal protein L4 [Sulfolobus islandicus]C3MVH9.1 RecName: Full=Large ribosomal subunit protein uL4; AltName: Full=50S ribosomal protein L4 [Sulfolobus islandicus M.14.25]C3N5S8.1 RecName: Full=Large ribosomal subunit protein uL4; AltName: Full=50S ribosomal protein L4 [Sulfolobus islandicus M.16.27]C4KHF7.1 RecName: Full=Large ribosomal subunit protein uL4; AltName: Full=50S ribosomal protein L4 [Sulfolobus islandicus M.16.4]ACP38174.1 ribosomal protein L4/L1e [Sulfolobus islandicus 
MYLELVKKNSVILDKDGNKVKEVELPFIFSFPVRKDIIRRVFLAEFTHSLQPKGRDPMAGKRTSAESFGINLGMARVPRVKNSGEAALAPNTVGGRLTFPPSVDKKLVEEVNDKEKQLAVISALSATADTVFVKARGHVFKDSVSFPIVVTDDIVSLKTASEVEEFLEKIGVYDDVKRVKERIRIRAGKGKMRGRKYKEPIGPLIIVHDSNSPIVKAARNIAGVDVVNAKDVSVIHLAPGAHPGRLTIYTETSIKILDERLSKRLVS